MDSMKSFLAKRLIIGILVAGGILWGVNVLLKKSESAKAPAANKQTGQLAAGFAETASHPETAPTIPEAASRSVSNPVSPLASLPTPAEKEMTESTSSRGASTETAQTAASRPPMTVRPESIRPPASESSGEAAPESSGVKGVAFVDALIKPLDYELNGRFWGWRPNDLIDVTDNVENYQRGVLEVTRRAARILMERISRTGDTSSFNKNLEDAMNWLMVKADTYWFPSPETKYQEALDEMKEYKKALIAGKESFFTRTDNLIPLLQAFEEILGSCEENLVKKVEKDGSKVGFFASDDYFYYAQGVAGAMHTILEAVGKDFGTTIESRRGMEALNSAIESCQHAIDINPLIILNSDPSSLWANHRANMAAPISHAKYYIEVLITALST